MTVENLFTDVLNNIVKAQYESYVFSQSLGALDQNLLPIPTAEIKEMTLEVNYAYEDKEEFSFLENYDTPSIIDSLSDILKNFFQQYQRRLISEVNMSEASPGEEWPEVRRNLSMDVMVQYMMDHVKAGFLKSADAFFNSSKQEKVATADVLAFLESILQETIHDCIIRHPDMEAFVGNIGWESINDHIHSYLTKHAPFISNVTQKSVKRVPKRMNIIVDAHLLQNLPPEAIQKAKVVMKMRNIIVEK